MKCPWKLSLQRLWLDDTIQCYVSYGGKEHEFYDGYQVLIAHPATEYRLTEASQDGTFAESNFLFVLNWALCHQQRSESETSKEKTKALKCWGNITPALIPLSLGCIFDTGELFPGRSAASAGQCYHDGRSKFDQQRQQRSRGGAHPDL